MEHERDNLAGSQSAPIATPLSKQIAPQIKGLFQTEWGPTSVLTDSQNGWSSSDGLDGGQFIRHPNRVRYRRMAGDPLVERCTDSRGYRFGHVRSVGVPDDPSHAGVGEWYRHPWHSMIGSTCLVRDKFKLTGLKPLLLASILGR